MKKKTYISNQEVQRRLNQQKKTLLTDNSTKTVQLHSQLLSGSNMKLGFWVNNWQTGWKWFSNVAFAGIVAVQAFYDTLPPELILALPTDTQSKITLCLAVLGLMGRFINQSKPKHLPPVSDAIKEDA